MASPPLRSSLTVPALLRVPLWREDLGTGQHLPTSSYLQHLGPSPPGAAVLNNVFPCLGPQNTWKLLLALVAVRSCLVHCC